MDGDYIAFSNNCLYRLEHAYTITHKTYALGGRTIATRISGNQEGDSNGLYYIHSGHLGSTSVMSYGQGYVQQGEEVLDSTARYLPLRQAQCRLFGDWRVEPGHNLTDQAFTGQKHNMDLGLYYYNARFYLPGIGRFASADTIVPDPMNPQQFNRYTYVLNNPLRFVDPTGHCVEAFDGATREDNLQSDDNLCWSIFYTWFDRGYSGLDPAWDYVREDIWFIEELYLQHGVQFRDAWDHHWSIDQVVDDELYAQRCYGLDCSVSYRRLSISSGGGYLTLKMNGAAAWLFQSFYNTTGGSGQSITKPIRGIGTDPNTYLREAMQNYGTAYTDYWDAVGNAIISGTGFTISGVSMVAAPNYLSGTGLVASGAGLWSSINAMNDASARQSTYLGQVNQHIYALEVRIYD